MTRHSPLLLDACVVLSLYATRRMEEILAANRGPFLVAEAVIRESLFIHVVAAGGREREPVTLIPLLASNVLVRSEPENESELATLFELSLQLDDGEAMSCAIALHRGCRIATDVAKTIRLMGPRLTIVGTLDLVRTWAEETGAPQFEVRSALIGIAERGYVPNKGHPQRPWWDSLFGGAR